MLNEVSPTKDINQSSVFKVFCWFPLINIKAVYVFDDISWKIHRDRFYMVLSLYVFIGHSFSLLSENKLPDDVLLIQSYYLDCIALTLDVSLLTPSIAFSTAILYLVLYQLFITFFTSKSLCCQKDLLQNQNNIVIMLALVKKLVYWIIVQCL